MPIARPKGSTVNPIGASAFNHVSRLLCLRPADEEEAPGEEGYADADGHQADIERIPTPSFFM